MPRLHNNMHGKNFELSLLFNEFTILYVVQIFTEYSDGYMKASKEKYSLGL